MIKEIEITGRTTCRCGRPAWMSTQIMEDGTKRFGQLICCVGLPMESGLGSSGSCIHGASNREVEAVLKYEKIN